MSKLLAMMKAKNQAKVSSTSINQMTKATIVEQEIPTAPKASVEQATTIKEFSTKVSEMLSEAEQKVKEQQDAGVYDLDPQATEILGADADVLVNTMRSLDAALIEKTPEIRTLSRDIRRNLEQYPELVHILTDEQLHIMVSGYLTIANVKTAPKTKAAKTAAANKKADAVLKTAGKLSLDDF